MQFLLGEALRCCVPHVDPNPVGSRTSDIPCLSAKRFARHIIQVPETSTLLYVYNNIISHYYFPRIFRHLCRVQTWRAPSPGSYPSRARANRGLGMQEFITFPSIVVLILCFLSRHFPLALSPSLSPLASPPAHAHFSRICRLTLSLF